MYPRSNLKMGDWKATCDRCGFDFHASQLKATWDNLMVCGECWEPRHPQDFQRGVPDDPSVEWTRPDQITNSSGLDIEGNTIESLNVNETVDDANKALTVGTNAPIQIWNTPLTGNLLATLADGTQAGDYFKIYRTAGGNFSLLISPLTGRNYLIQPNINELVHYEWDGSSWDVVSTTRLGL